MASLPPPPVYSDLVLWLKLYGDLLDHFLFAEKETLVIGYFVLLPAIRLPGPHVPLFSLGHCLAGGLLSAIWKFKKKWYVNEH